MRPHRAEHADKVTPIAGANPRFTVRRMLEGYAYPQNGNVHNPTPRYCWLLQLDGRDVSGPMTRKRDVVEAAREPGALKAWSR